MGGFEGVDIKCLGRDGINDLAKGDAVDAGFLERLLGGNRTWCPSCVVILDAEASVKAAGPDSLATGGQKSYAPRVSSGRIPADGVCLLKEDNVLLVVEQTRHKDAVGQTHIKHTLMIVDVSHVVAIEFPHIQHLDILGVPPPPEIRETEFKPGTLVG